MDTINFTNKNENVNKQVSLFWNEERQVIFNWGISAMNPLPSPPPQSSSPQKFYLTV